MRTETGAEVGTETGTTVEAEGAGVKTTGVGAVKAEVGAVDGAAGAQEYEGGVSRLLEGPAEGPGRTWYCSTG